MKLKSEFEGLELAKWKMIKPRIKKTQIKFEKHRRRKKLVQTSQILTPMLTIIQQRKMMHAYKIAYLGMKSRTLIRELIPIIGFFMRGDSGSGSYTISSEVKTTNNLNDTRTSWGRAGPSSVISRVET